MSVRGALLVCAGLILAVAAPARAAPMPLDEAARLFGSRSSTFAPDLSPGGTKVIYLSAGPGATTIAHVLDLTTMADRVLGKSSGKPEQLSWCGFVDDRWAVCRFTGWRDSGGLIFRLARTIAVDTVDGTIRPLGVQPGEHDNSILQFDGRIIDWLPDEGGSVLMQRNHAGQADYPNSVGVDRIRIDPLKFSVAERQIARDIDYMTDGHGVVRLPWLQAILKSTLAR